MGIKAPPPNARFQDLNLQTTLTGIKTHEIRGLRGVVKHIPSTFSPEARLLTP